MSEIIQAYPLQWPGGWRRYDADKRTGGPFKVGNSRTALTIPVAARRVLNELVKLGVDEDDVIISSNFKTSGLGLTVKRPADQGIAVYWKVNGKQRCMPMDRYTSVEQNLAAVAATLEAMRAIERHGGAEILDRVFTGFAALPPAPSWREQLGFTPDEKVTPDQLKKQYHKLSMTKHPDKGGTASEFALLTQAYERAQEEVK